MKRDEINDLILSSLDPEGQADEACRKLGQEGLSYSFGPSFRDNVLDRIFTRGRVINREIEFLRSWNRAFYRIALTGVAAIVFLLLSIYLSEGSFSLNTLLGLNNGSDESIISLLTGN